MTDRPVLRFELTGSLDGGTPSVLCTATIETLRTTEAAELIREALTGMLESLNRMADDE